MMNTMRTRLGCVWNFVKIYVAVSFRAIRSMYSREEAYFDNIQYFLESY